MMRCFFILILLTTLSGSIVAQTDPEFPPGFIMHLKVHDGMSTSFRNSNDLFIGGLQLVPQVTAIPNLLRAGIIADGFYTNKNLQAAFGPTISVKLKTFQAGVFGSAGNLHLSVDHLWGTKHQRLIGGGINADLGNLLVFGISAHRDYRLENWWFQNSLGIRISKKPIVKEPFNQ